MSSTYRPPILAGLRDYDILEKIAEGSMTSIYKARHAALDHLMAIKVPHRNVMKNEVLRDRFCKEYRVGNLLNHPNIVRMMEFGQDGEGFYLVMEYVDGPDLWERIRREGRLEECEAVNIIVQIGQGLHQAHRHGIIHRDVKPDNILLTKGGVAKLGDLGLIKELEAENELTCPGKGLGTPNFMSPEQFSQANNAGIRCDVYSLAATLYMAVTGEVPFQGDDISIILSRKLSNDLPPPRQIVPELSERLDWTIRRAMQVDPKRRHADCLDFIEALTVEAVGKPPPRRSGLRKKRLEKERRCNFRHDCTLSTICELLTTIHSDNTIELDRWPGKVVNLSLQGVGLLMKRRLEPGTLATVLLESADRSFLSQRDIRIVRVSPSREKRWYMGAIFSTPLEATELRRLL